MLIAVLMTLKLHCNVLFLSVLETLVGEQVGVLVGVLMMLNYHCDMFFFCACFLWGTSSCAFCPDDANLSS